MTPDPFEPALDGPRPLTRDELAALRRLGFGDIADRIVAGTCPDCGLNRLGVAHAYHCARRKKNRPKGLPRGAAAPQPWEAKPARRSS